MAFWEWVSHLSTRAWLHTKAGAQNVGEHLSSKVIQAPGQWWQEQHAERTRLQQQRQEMLRDLEEIKNRPGMAHEQRAAEIGRITSEMPGGLQVVHAHPAARFATGLVRVPLRVLGHTLGILGRAVRGTGSAATRAAPHVTPGSNTWLIIIALLYHFVLQPTNLIDRILFNFLLILITIFFIFDRSERNGDTYRTLFLWIFIGEIFIPYIVSEFSIIRNIDFIRLYIANGMILLTWVYYAVFVRGQEVSGGFTTVCKAVIIIFWILVAVSFIGTRFVDFSDVELDTASAEQWYAAKKLWSKAGDGFGIFIDSIKNTFTRAQSIIDMRLKSATGEYYYGIVEENEKEPLGVTLENLKASQTEYTPQDPVTVFATLKARTLDDTVKVQIACYAGKGTTAIKGKVYPDNSFAVSTLQQEELDCSFDRLPEETHQITYSASFNFETIAYLKRYFADRDSMAAASRQNIDLLDEYQIQDQQPIAHYTNGPVVIGMGPEQVLIGVSPTYAVEPRIGITIDSGHGWNGKIKELRQLILILPKELSLDTQQCTNPHWSNYSVADCVADEQRYNSKIAQECAGVSQCLDDACAALLADYNAYSLDVSSSTYKNIEDYVTVTCRMKVNDIPSLLGATPIATHYFYAKTRYTYEVSEDTTVVVEEEEDVYQPDGETATTKTDTTTIPSFTIDQKEKELQFIFYNYQEHIFAAQQQYGVPACTQAGIIALVSDANPQYHEDGRKGLMGVTDQLASALGTDPTIANLYDVATNVNLGNKYLDQINDITKDNVGTETLKAYYSMLYVQNSLSPAVDSDSASQFASLVEQYITECKKIGLENSPLIEIEKEPSVSVNYMPYSSLSSSLPPIFIYQYPQGTLLELDFRNNWIPGSQATVTLSYGGKSIDSIITYTINAPDVNVDVGMGTFSTVDWSVSSAGHWFGFDGYGLIQILFNEKDTTDQKVEYRFFDNFVTTVTLLENEIVSLIDGVLYARYTGSDIEIFTTENIDDLTDEKEVCDIAWYEYIAYATCKDAGITDNDDDMLPGLLVRNIKTEVNRFGVGYANVQIEWSNEKQLEAIK